MTPTAPESPFLRSGRSHSLQRCANRGSLSRSRASLHHRTTGKRRYWWL